MHGYIDPFADRPQVPEDDPEDPDDRDDETEGLEAIVEDARSGRREAPFSDDSAHRVRPVGR